MQTLARALSPCLISPLGCNYCSIYVLQDDFLNSPGGDLDAGFDKVLVTMYSPTEIERIMALPYRPTLKEVLLLDVPQMCKDYMHIPPASPQPLPSPQHTDSGGSPEGEENRAPARQPLQGISAPQRKGAAGKTSSAKAKGQQPCPQMTRSTRGKKV
jgi:hypothetical protein